MSVKTDPHTQERLLEEGRYAKTHYIGRYGWVSLIDNAASDWAKLEAMIVVGDRRTAPKRLARQLTNESDGIS